MTAARVELNGEPLGPGAFVAGMTAYGHFTAMQVRDGRVRGLAYHLERLATSTRLLFGTDLDPDRVRSYVRKAIADEPALSVRVVVVTRSFDEPMTPEILVRTHPPRPPDPAPLRLRTVRYQRELPQVKHLGTFGLIHQSRQARLAGFDDALFVDAGGRISEASIWNAGFLAGDTIVWPEAAVLPGITMLVQKEALRRLGVPQQTRPVRPADLREFDAMFLTNSETPGRPVAAVDDLVLPPADRAVKLLAEAYETVPWDEI
ncbi:aminotransferase class IV [Amycolatopsis australiensis]|uniref:Branched-chain amino acid aminotransferase/4-amino-4-deoxychorismate lyase n=1 Tax=Amycolatopsis australiensis TaxID=546364 RepID=A0A1K1S8M6_9PSEU|nr:aminotransferase class IV [Amycolatopsis australiensis]SFW80365.1 Branched-chain amino acid aminotransferase/4-amino-4-deoxychorismate lyase [Amycolatopsis australiensis]